MMSLGQHALRPDALGDLAALAEVDEETVLAALRERFLQQRIYTYIGDILVAMNPFHPLPTYGREISYLYRRRLTYMLPPHIFAVGSRAYHAMLGHGSGGPRDQCVVISGESGAGKTECTKLLLWHTMNLCKGNLHLEQQILQVNPLLEAFGNAQTVKNDNSSRFGKYIQLRFQKDTVQGAKLSEYLLEKSRVVQQDFRERNFHIFYYMFAGLSSEQKEMYGLLDPSLYRYINGQFGTEEVAECWKHKYQEVCNALDMVGFQEQEKVDLQVILAGVLSLGNVTFEPEEGSRSVKVSKASQGWLKAAAAQFGVQADELLECLICTRSVTKGQQFQRFHTKEEAEGIQNSIAKETYSRMFGWIVYKINELLAENVDREVEMREIGLLDFFGFENFAVNSFEQLCINLADEKLQYFFNHHIFKLEQAAYKEEGLPCETITFNDNEDILRLFLSWPFGVLNLLDEHCELPHAMDSTFVEKLYSCCNRNSHFQRAPSYILGFTIIHYAGEVKYSARGFLEKNRDTFPANVRELFSNSVTPLLSTLFTATISSTGTLMPHAKDQKHMTSVPEVAEESCSRRKPFAAAQFQYSLRMLMEKLHSASPHFVRCIKPNNQKEPGVLDNEVVLQQLRYSGLLETIHIRRNGFAWRPSFKEFAERFGILLVKPGVPLTKESCLEILQSTQLEGWICGKSRLFFKYGHQEQLEKYVEKLERAAVVIQKVFRGFRCKKSFQKLLAELRAQAHRLQKEAERERIQQLDSPLAAEAQARSSIPDPVSQKRHPQPSPHPSDHSEQPPVPQPCSKLTESTPSGNFLNPSVPRPVLGTEECTGEEAKMREGATLGCFEEAQAQKVMEDDEVFPTWLHGMLSRREAENLLIDKPLGCFLVWTSQSRPGYILTYRRKDCCRHCVIQMLPNARYVILGQNQAHASLTELVQYYQVVGIQPFEETLTVPYGQKSYESLNYKNVEGLALSSPADKGKSPPAKKICLSLSSTDTPPLQWFNRTENSQNQQTPDKSRRTPNSGESSQPASPHFLSSIRLAMQEIQQFSSTSMSTSEERSSLHWGYIV